MPGPRGPGARRSRGGGCRRPRCRRPGEAGLAPSPGTAAAAADSAGTPPAPLRRTVCRAARSPTVGLTHRPNFVLTDTPPPPMQLGTTPPRPQTPSQPPKNSSSASVPPSPTVTALSNGAPPFPHPRGTPNTPPCPPRPQHPPWGHPQNLHPPFCPPTKTMGLQPYSTLSSQGQGTASTPGWVTERILPPKSFLLKYISVFLQHSVTNKAGGAGSKGGGGGACPSLQPCPRGSQTTQHPWERRREGGTPRPQGGGQGETQDLVLSPPAGAQG